jgi:hypothetical protein
VVGISARPVKGGFQGISARVRRVINKRETIHVIGITRKLVTGLPVLKGKGVLGIQGGGKW